MGASSPWMVYGAYGHTGRRIAEEAVRRGQTPVLAGRREEPLGRLASELGCQARVFRLRDPAEITPNLEGLQGVLHCAGPFSVTAEPMIDACLQTGVHYLDITGEIEVIEAAAARHRQAEASGVVLMPAVGFDVVPSDCLAAMLAGRLPGATRLQLAFTGTGTISPGTARTMIESLPRGGRVRRNGRIEKVPLGAMSMRVPFREGTRWAVTIPWGDVASAWHSTGVPNVEVYVAMSLARIRWLRSLRPLAILLRLPLPSGIVRRGLRWFMLGRTSPDDVEPPGSLWGRADDESGNSVQATLRTPGAYRLTCLTALACMKEVLAGRLGGGFFTPSTAFGAEFILGFPETDVRFTPDQ